VNNFQFSNHLFTFHDLHLLLINNIYFSFDILSIFKTFISSSNALISCPEGKLPKIPEFIADEPIFFSSN
jgi:hypothetical protein